MAKIKLHNSQSYNKGGIKMKSHFGLEYVQLNMENLNIAYKIQKETWPDDHDSNCKN